jgi:cyclase
VLSAGANKVSTSSAAFRKPGLIAEMAKALGAEKVTVAIDVGQNEAMHNDLNIKSDFITTKMKWLWLLLSSSLTG